MALPNITPPPEHSRRLGWNSMNHIRSELNSARPKIAAGMTAATASTLYDELARLIAPVQANLDAGLYDGDAETKANAQSMLFELGSIATVAAPMKQKYHLQMRNLQASQSGSLLSDAEAAAQIAIEQADIDSLAAAVDTALGV